MTTTEHPTPPTSDLPHLVDIATLADHLGVDVRHIRRLVSERRIPFIKWGHLLRFDPTEITAWIDDNRHHPGRPRLP
ncbi:helix-turn-helix domain-containing protein [Iamia majanohamensis]|uniref:Helix-turn-helix domain-containing protein n=1 Tax=Iamia majanohamensis TaxID=467976 RepID=A0AAE9YCJ9_9ACTN|nr:helix-turn-helix domain-containing protein [Iamia majanohamensis]WCO68718.1 helix-turn-helix domain-containing protein [Iamia majanohamensis]